MPARSQPAPKDSTATIGFVATSRLAITQSEATMQVVGERRDHTAGVDFVYLRCAPSLRASDSLSSKLPGDCPTRSAKWMPTTKPQSPPTLCDISCPLIEARPFDKIVIDANRRHKAFFEKLGAG